MRKSIFLKYTVMIRFLSNTYQIKTLRTFLHFVDIFMCHFNFQQKKLTLQLSAFLLPKAIEDDARYWYGTRLTLSSIMWKMTKKTLKIFGCLYRKISKYVCPFFQHYARVDFSRQPWHFFENLHSTDRFTVLTNSKVLSIFKVLSTFNYVCRANNPTIEALCL